MHAFVFWGFVAFGGYTHGRVPLRPGHRRSDAGARWFYAYRIALTPFAVAVLAGILYLLVRRAIVRPVALGPKLSIESMVIALFIATLMITFLLTFRLVEGSTAAHVNWWVHAIVILLFMALIPASKHLHLVLSPITVFLKSPGAREPAEPRFREGTGRPRDGEGSRQQVGARRVHLRRVRTLSGELPGVGRRQGAESENDRPADAGRPVGGASRERKLGEVYSEKVLWQCTTCGAARTSARSASSTCRSSSARARAGVERRLRPTISAPMYNNLERRSNIWGLGYDQRTKFVQSAALETFDPASTTCSSGSAAPDRSTPTSRKSLRSLFGICAAKDVKFGVLSKSAAPATPAKRTGNEYMYQELATGNIEDLKAAGRRRS
jgi:hypothetical protein